MVLVYFKLFVKDLTSCLLLSNKEDLFCNKKRGKIVAVKTLDTFLSKIAWIGPTVDD